MGAVVELNPDEIDDMIRQDREAEAKSRAEEALRLAEEAHRAETMREDLGRLESQIQAAATQRNFLDNCARADAINGVLRAICRRHGQKVLAFGPADAGIAHAHGLALIDLQNQPPVEVDPAYLQGSTPTALATAGAALKAMSQ